MKLKHSKRSATHENCAQNSYLKTHIHMRIRAIATCSIQCCLTYNHMYICMQYMKHMVRTAESEAAQRERVDQPLKRDYEVVPRKSSQQHFKYKRRAKVVNINRTGNETFALTPSKCTKELSVCLQGLCRFKLRAIYIQTHKVVTAE